MSFNSLVDLISSLGVDPTTAQLQTLYNEFNRDFVSSSLVIDGLNVKVILKKSTVEGFEAYPETFVHLITRKNGNKRVFDRHRANKIHWVRFILENRGEEDVTFFQYPENDGTLRDYYWYKDGDFLVIMEKITPDYVVITSFHIDNERNRKYFGDKEKWYEANK